MESHQGSSATKPQAGGSGSAEERKSFTTSVGRWGEGCCFRALTWGNGLLMPSSPGPTETLILTAPKQWLSRQPGVRKREQAGSPHLLTVGEEPRGFPHVNILL